MSFKNTLIALVLAVLGTLGLYFIFFTLHSSAEVLWSAVALALFVLLLVMGVVSSSKPTPKKRGNNNRGGNKRNVKSRDGSRPRRGPRSRREGSSEKTDNKTPLEPSKLTIKGNRETGVVKWFNIKKGYGFIIRDGGDEVFVHLRDVRQNDGRKVYLYEGQLVEYAIGEGEKGMQAADVVVISEAN